MDNTEIETILGAEYGNHIVMARCRTILIKYLYDYEFIYESCKSVKRPDNELRDILSDIAISLGIIHWIPYIQDMKTGYLWTPTRLSLPEHTLFMMDRFKFLQTPETVFWIILEQTDLNTIKAIADKYPTIYGYLNGTNIEPEAFQDGNDIIKILNLKQLLVLHYKIMDYDQFHMIDSLEGKLPPLVKTKYNEQSYKYAKEQYKKFNEFIIL